MGKKTSPTIPYVEAHNQGDRQRPTAIVIRSSFTTSETGAALAVAANLHHSTAPKKSYHYVVDESQVIQGVPDKIVSFYGDARPAGIISILVCAEPLIDVDMWDNMSRVKVLNRTAELVADLSMAYGIRRRYMDFDNQLRWHKWRSRRRGGIMLQVAGTWPNEDFLNDISDKVSTKK